MQLHTIGIDLGKNLFHLVGLNQRGEAVVHKKFSRKQLLHFTANLQVELIGMEACGGSHFLGRALREQGEFSLGTCFRPAAMSIRHRRSKMTEAVRSRAALSPEAPWSQADWARWETDMADHDHEAISDLIETYRQGFLTLDSARLGSIWDKAHDPLIYIAQEKEEPIRGWPAIERYLTALPQNLESISAMELDGIAIDPLGDAAAVYFRFRVKGKLRKREGSHEPVGRVTMICRRTPNGWRTIHYHESALAAHAVRKS